MGPVGTLARASARARWRLLAVLVVVTGLVGAVVIASVAGSIRGREALDEFVAFNRPGTMAAFVDPSLPIDEQVALLEDMVAAGGDHAFVSYSSVIVLCPGPAGSTRPGRMRRSRRRSSTGRSSRRSSAPSSWTASSRSTRARPP